MELSTRDCLCSSLGLVEVGGIARSELELLPAGRELRSRTSILLLASLIVDFQGSINIMSKFNQADFK